MTSPLNHYTTLSTGFLAYNHSCPDSLPIPYPNFKQPVQHTEVPTHRSILDCGDQGPGLGSLGCHKPPHTEWLKQQRFIRSHSYRTDIQGQGVSKAVLPQQVLVENPFFASSCIWQLLAFLDSWLQNSSFHIILPPPLSLCLLFCAKYPSASLLQGHLSLGISIPLTQLHLQRPLPQQVTFTGSEHEIQTSFLGGIIQPMTSSAPSPSSATHPHLPVLLSSTSVYFLIPTPPLTHELCSLQLTVLLSLQFPCLAGLPFFSTCLGSKLPSS